MKISMKKYQIDFKVRRLAKIIVDLALIALSYYTAFWLRFDGQIEPLYQRFMFSSLPIILTIYFVILLCFGIYRGMWRYSSVRDLAAIVVGDTVGLISSYWVLWMIFHAPAPPRSMLMIFWFVVVFLLGGTRLVYTLTMMYWPHFNEPTKRILIVGAGRAGEMIARQLLYNQQLFYKPIGFVDDDMILLGDRIHQVPVMGNLKDIPAIVKEKKINEVILAIPSATAPQMRRAVQLCEEAGVSFRTVPGAKELMNGQVSLEKVRKVKIEDLLERTPTVNNPGYFKKQYAGKRVLVTGAAGSIGSELCCQLAHIDLESLIMLDRAETDLFDLDYNVRRVQNEQIKTVCLINDITQYQQLERVFKLHRPQIVFHAAAYKHVHLMEQFPHEAVINNLAGTMHVARAAAAAGSERLVLISTDKAVNPTCVMGAVKRAAELYCALQSKTPLRHVVVRFGNVLASRGSVIPLFERQIRDGGPITVTSKEVERFFMTIPEAVELVLQAGSIGEGGDTFVLDMGEPVKIYDLAKHLIVLSGLEPEVDIPIKITGLRKGEKLYEELWSAEETSTPTAFAKIMRVTSDLPHSPKFYFSVIDELIGAAMKTDQEKIRKLLMKIIANAQLESND